jgi:hypothetical protein
MVHHLLFLQLDVLKLDLRNHDVVHLGPVQFGLAFSDHNHLCCDLIPHSTCS